MLFSVRTAPSASCTAEAVALWRVAGTCAEDLDRARREGGGAANKDKADISCTKLAKFEAEFDRFLRAGEASVRAERSLAKQGRSSIDF